MNHQCFLPTSGLLGDDKEDVLNYLQQIVVNAEKSFKCLLCGKLNRTKWNAKRHMILLHTRPTNDVCPHCSKVFKHKYYLDEHIRSRECQ